MKLKGIIEQFNTTPFLFAGSGMTRRYYNLPDWKGLLNHYAQKISMDSYAYQSYENTVRESGAEQGLMPEIASLIERDFNRLWFENSNNIRSGSDRVSECVSKGISPFKAEMAEYIRSLSVPDQKYEDEIRVLSEISSQNISGIITTNYDLFFENICQGYRTFVGQDELIFSQLQGIAEIYKIHGSVEDPSSIVITARDYEKFDEKSKYLSAKLMTIFMEYPIIFMGYSISDPNIQRILLDMVECLPPEKVDLLQRRFVFVSYDATQKEPQIASLSMTFGTKAVEMTRVITADFGELYEALKGKKAAFPVKLLRRFKDDLYRFALTSEQRSTLQVAPLTDSRINEETLALTIGLAETGVYGLARAVTSENWYRNIILEDLQYSPDELLEYSYVDLAKQNSWRIPVWYYISRASHVPDIVREKAAQNYSDIVSDDAIARNRGAVRQRSIDAIWQEEEVYKAVRLIGNLPEDKVDLDQLEMVLNDLFGKQPDILQKWKTPHLSNLRRLIRIYDFLKYKAKTP